MPVTLDLSNLAAILPDPAQWEIQYRPDFRGDNGICYYTQGLLSIRDRRDGGLLVGVADTNAPLQDLTEFFSPVAVSVSPDDCGEEVLFSCGNGATDTRQALVVSIRTGGESLTLRAGAAGDLPAFHVEVNTAANDTGHPCCNDCGSGVSELAFVLQAK